MPGFKGLPVGGVMLGGAPGAPALPVTVVPGSVNPGGKSGVWGLIPGGWAALSTLVPWEPP